MGERRRSIGEDVLVEVLGGAVVAGGAGLVAAATPGRASELAAAAGGLALGGMAATMTSRRRTNAPALISLAGFDNPFFPHMFGALSARLDAQGIGVLESHASPDYDAAAQTRLIDKYVARPGRICGAIVNPVDPLAYAVRLKQFALALRDKPFVVIDTFAGDWVTNLSNTMYVGTDQIRVGELAVDAAGVYLTHVTSPRVLVLGGHEQRQRQLAFAQRMRALRLDADLVIDEATRLTRAMATERMVAHLNGEFDLVFATNDEMSLGVVEVVEALPALRRPLIIGVDGTATAKRSIGSGSCFVNTVCQDVSGMVDVACQAFMNIAAVESRCVLLEPSMFAEARPVPRAMSPAS